MVKKVCSYKSEIVFVGEDEVPPNLEQLDFDGWEYKEDEDGNCTYDSDD